MMEPDLFTYATMGEGVEFDKFNELEEKIKLMLKEQSSLKRKNQELEELLRKKEIELQETIEKNKGLNEERETVRLKIDALLDLLRDTKGI
ncbi:MAG: cell division protein ZapB [Syntrophales bacterium]|nr:cell division protein ZapB [Syntrophales bacterium]